jgi:hypothetical protein
MGKMTGTVHQRMTSFVGASVKGKGILLNIRKLRLVIGPLDGYEGRLGSGIGHETRILVIKDVCCCVEFWNCGET